MKNNTINATDYPPPPPPPTQSPSKMDSHKILVVSILLVIVIASAGVLYYLTTNSISPGDSTTNPTVTTKPIGTATPSPTGMTTPVPAATGMDNGIANLRAGWATYTITSYHAGDEPTENTMKYAVTEGTYSGTACWLMNVEMTLNQESGTMKTIMTYWISKSTGDGIHIRTQIYMNDELVNEYEEDILPGEGGRDIPQPVDMSTATTTETITVEAGTFTCGKITVTTPTGTSSAWYNSDIPVIGLVKIETMSGGSTQSTTELTAYGN